MSHERVYPRLPSTVARELLKEVQAAAQSGGVEAVTRLAASSHPRAACVPTGGRHATPSDIERVRSEVLSSVGTWVSDGQVARPQQVEFDALLGKSLHHALRIMPADAAHAGTWSFLTLVLLPDVAVTRFPDLPEERGLGLKRERNVLRRAWMRWDVLGDMLTQGDVPLGEDELVGLLERTSVARNRALVRQLALAVLSFKGEGARSAFARELYKAVRYRTGPLMLDAMTDLELEGIVREEAQRVRGAAASPA